MFCRESDVLIQVLKIKGRVWGCEGIKPSKNLSFTFESPLWGAGSLSLAYRTHALGIDQIFPSGSNMGTKPHK